MRDNKKSKLPNSSSPEFQKPLLLYILTTSLICLIVSILLAYLDQSEYFFFLFSFIVLTIWATVIGQLVTPKDAANFIRTVGRDKK